MSSHPVQILPVSDEASLVVFATPDALPHVHRFAAAMRAAADPCVRNVQPASESVLVVFDPYLASHAELEALIATRLAAAAALPSPAPQSVEIPVHYGDDSGPDLTALAKRHDLAAAEVVRLHTEPEYVVAFLGFAPGFAYLDGLSPQLATPRHDAPRALVPAGSVAIGGNQTGVYPVAGPGGWQIIGRTPMRMFDAHSAAPSRLAPGDRVRFRSIRRSEFGELAHAATDAAAPASVPVSDGSAGIVRVETPGLLTTVQDPGRPGWAHVGVSASGAADPLALRLGNRLVGNPDDAAALEMTLVGGTFVFEQAALLALVGAAFDARCDGVPVPWWRTCAVRAGARLEIGPARTGARCLLCVRGGIVVPPILGSASTHLLTGMGGVGGRALVAGDRLALGRPGDRQPPAQHRLDPAWIDSLYAPAALRVTPAAQTQRFDFTARAQLTATTWRVREQSNRMGIRLAGDALRGAADAGVLPSEGVPRGAIQVPPDGQPIVLFVEHQTTGGYAKIANVCNVDLHRVGQLRPRDAVRFDWIDFDTATRLLHEREAEVERRIPGARP